MHLGHGHGSVSPQWHDSPRGHQRPCERRDEHRGERTAAAERGARFIYFWLPTPCQSADYRIAKLVAADSNTDGANGLLQLPVPLAVCERQEHLSLPPANCKRHEHLGSAA